MKTTPFRVKLLMIFLIFYIAIAPALNAISINHSPSPDIERSYGGSIWSDPCTHDGFLVGLSLVFHGWITATGAMMKAIYLDNCFN